MIRRDYVNLDHGLVHFRHAGNLTKPAFILLHQAPSSSIMFDPLMHALAGDFRVLAPDLPGFGQSDCLPQTSITGFADAIAAWMKALEVESAFVFGHHTGATVAAALAARSPQTVRGLVLSGPPLLDAAQRAALPGLAPWCASREDGVHLAELWAKFAQKSANAPLALKQREFALALMAGDVVRDTYASVADYDLAADLDHISSPALVVGGTQDSLFACTTPAASRLNRASTHIVKGADTYVCETHTGELSAALKHFARESVHGS